MRAMEFQTAAEYINPSRCLPEQLSTHLPEKGKNEFQEHRYITRRGSTNPALLVTLVEVQAAMLVYADQFKTEKGYYQQKWLMASPFEQELDFLTSNFGTVFDTSELKMPVRLPRGEKLRREDSEQEIGFTFATRPGRPRECCCDCIACDSQLDRRH